MNFDTSDYTALTDYIVVHPANSFENLPCTKDTIHVLVKSVGLGTIPLRF